MLRDLSGLLVNGAWLEVVSGFRAVDGRGLDNWRWGIARGDVTGGLGGGRRVDRGQGRGRDHHSAAVGGGGGVAVAVADGLGRRRPVLRGLEVVVDVGG